MPLLRNLKQNAQMFYYPLVTKPVWIGMLRLTKWPFNRGARYLERFVFKQPTRTSAHQALMKRFVVSHLWFVMDSVSSYHANLLRGRAKHLVHLSQPFE